MPLKTVQQKSPIFKNLTGGLNVREAVTEVGDNEGIEVTNLAYYTGGALVRRGGWKKLFTNSPTTTKLLGIFQPSFNVNGVITNYIVVTDGTNVWKAIAPTMSESAVTWTQITGSVTLDNSQPYKFAMMANYMVGYNGKSVFLWTGSGNITAMPIAVAGNAVFNGITLCGTTLYAGSNQGIIYSSQDGVNWTPQTVGLPGGAITIYSPVILNGTLYAGASNGSIYSSPNGTSWTQQTTGLPGGTVVIFTPTIFQGALYSGTSNGRIFTSTDGVNWTAITTGLPLAGNLYSPSLLGSTLISGAANGSVYTSTNGTSWTQRTTGLPNDGTTIIFSPNIFSATAYSGANNGAIYSSPDGTTWTKQTTGLPGGTQTLYSPTVFGSTLVSGAGNGSVYTSMNGTSWTQRTNGLVNAGILFSPTNFQTYLLISSNNGLLFQSSDAINWTLTSTVAGNITAPLSRQGLIWQNYFFWIGSNLQPDRLYFSNLADPTTYPSANFIDVPSPFDGDILIGAAILYGNLLVFKRFSIYVLQGSPPNNLILSKLNASVGCVDPATIVQADNLVYFVSDKGLYAANLFNVRQVCYKVEPRYTIAVPASSPANPMWAAHYKPRGQIFISMNYGSAYAAVWPNNDRILCHDYFNADQNGDPAVSEYIVNNTHFTLQTSKPNAATAPYIMGDYSYGSGSSLPVTVMASFYDQWVYVMTEGSLGAGGPQDEIAAIGSSYPPTDFMSKFYDFGDPDMVKTIRWVWTTGQLYNSINLQAGIAYNNSPTAVSFIDYNSNVVSIQSGNGTIWAIGVGDDGAISTQAGGNATYLQTPILTDKNGQNWQLLVQNDGAFDTEKTSLPATGQFVLVSTGGFQYIVGVDPDGAITTTEVFNPGLTIITPGKRSIVNPLIGQQSASHFGKYVQLYLSGIGILTQFSFDWIAKGRRN